MTGEAEINALIHTAMESLRQMMDVNTIIGDMLETPSGVSIIPVSRVSCGFISGGGQYGKEANEGLPFAGGSSAGVLLNPVGFLVVNGKDVRLIAAGGDTNVYDKAFDALPFLIETLKELFDNKKDKKDKKITEAGLHYKKRKQRADEKIYRD